MQYIPFHFKNCQFIINNYDFIIIYQGKMIKQTKKLIQLNFHYRKSLKINSSKFKQKSKTHFLPLKSYQYQCYHLFHRDMYKFIN